MTESAAASSSQPARRLDSWKEIARYLNRDESTVQRWEKRERMPVHRHVHDKRGSVYAYPAELDAWWQGRRQRLQPGNLTGAQTAVASPADELSAYRASDSRTWPRQWWVGVAGASVVLPVFLALTWLPRHAMRAPTTTPAIVRLTSTSGVNVDPALSPDGSLLAYASDRGGSGDLDIWIQPIGQERPTRLTTEPGDEMEPSFSPDGDSIIFAKGETGGIYIVAAAGGVPRQLVAGARARTPRFSPDGLWVTYWTGLPVWVIPSASASAPGSGTGSAPGATGALFVVPASGGSPRQVASDFNHARHGTWSPDSQKILFVGASEGDQDGPLLDWFVVGRDGGEPTRTGALEVLRRTDVKGVPIPGAWSADGTVVFATYDEGASNVWRLAISQSAGRVSGDPVRLTFGTAVERSPAVSASGRMAFTGLAENVDVWRLPLDAETGLASGALERATDNVAIDRLINVSDDGGTMVFVSSRTGTHEVWIREMPTGQDRPLAYPDARAARVSRDGSRVAVDRGTSEKRGVDLVTLRGGPSVSLCDDCNAGDWSPDGKRLVIHRGSPSRLLVRDLDSGREVELAAHPTWNLYRPRYSPDGRWIVFHTTNTPSLRQIYAVPASGGAPVPVEAWVPIVLDFGMQPSWAPSGAAIYYFSLRDGAFCAWVQPLDPVTTRPAGSPRAVQHFHRPGLRAVTGAEVTNHVAGGYLYVTLTSYAANIWMLSP